MKAKLSAIVVLFFLMACGSSEQKKDQPAEAAAEPQVTRYTIKCSNGQFLSVAADNKLVSNQPDAAKATVFEKIDLGGGKCALKVANGKFITDDRSKRSRLFADRDTNGEWETFEVIAVSETKANIRTSAGMFVCADGSAGDTLVADRQSAGDWETFEMLKQN